jgi:hypothetical protein
MPAARLRRAHPHHSALAAPHVVPEGGGIRDPSGLSARSGAWPRARRAHPLRAARRRCERGAAQHIRHPDLPVARWCVAGSPLQRAHARPPAAACPWSGVRPDARCWGTCVRECTSTRLTGRYGGIAPAARSLSRARPWRASQHSATAPGSHLRAVCPDRTMLRPGSGQGNSARSPGIGPRGYRRDRAASADSADGACLHDTN